jgi:hypothetical protein
VSRAFRNVKENAMTKEILPFVASHWQPIPDKPCLRGIFNITMPSGLVIYGISLFTRGTQRWIGLPRRRFIVDGKVQYAPVLEIPDAHTFEEFRDRALAALDALLGEKAGA